MYSVFGLQRFFYTLLGITIAIFFLAVWMAETSAGIATVSLFWKIGTGVFTTVFLLGSIPFVFKKAWRLYERASPGAFPDLSGRWVGTLESNINIQLAVESAAKSAGGIFDATDPWCIETEGLELLQVEVLIKSTLSSIDLSMVVKGEQVTRSHSVMCKPVCSNGGEPHKLYYVYRSNRKKPAADDESHHTGAAELDVRCDGSVLVMEGVYWTVRNWRNGRNTAGRLTLRKLSSE
ncbi:hypothetical protein [Pseudomonas sp. P105]|uniref:Cap15 family cyclic dinucleotide receptor domain-containing protein n=1 Tax=Pseudomonas sp. P105 TaxID=3049542 RepID=UPI002934B71F|nr:hypothetical protein [Pseudomonas sp. P105]WNZ79431.1 hypothetical protein QOM08_04895 [Pseudomonas sp. P105]